MRKELANSKIVSEMVNEFRDLSKLPKTSENARKRYEKHNRLSRLAKRIDDEPSLINSEYPVG